MVVGRIGPAHGPSLSSGDGMPTQDERAGPRPGLEGTAEAEVTPERTAVAMGSGEVRVLATPAVLALAEQAACRALEGTLGPEDLHMEVNSR